MVTDDERREVARRLRDSVEKRMAATGRGNGNSWSWLYRSVFGHYMGTEKGAKGHYVEVAHRLADLIEPSASATPTPLRRDTDASATLQPSQRDALLALADEMDAYTGCDDERCGRDMPPRAIHDYARRIREALGVEE